VLNTGTTNAQFHDNMDDNGALYRVFLSGAVAQILDFFLDHKEFDYSPGEISNKTGLALKTIFREIPHLMRYQLVYNSRKIGKVNMYKLNSDFEPVLLLEKFAIEISKLNVRSDQNEEPTHIGESKNENKVVNISDLNENIV
jgi:hypothetical protein